MKPKPRRASSKPNDKRRRNRPRPTPRWLKEQQDLDDVARRRCLMVLSVLSGEVPVTDAIVSTGISRQLYYQLEEKALRAMLRALAPGGTSEATGTPGADGMLRRMAELEERTKTLEQEKRRAERMLLLTRKLMGRGPVKTGKGGRPPRPRSKDTGANSSTSAPTKAMLPVPPVSAPPSTSTRDGDSAP